ncbi:MAG: hypothetical protein A2Z34_08210 [Planctomycetes bacterium RBG_16_59_8]|nr:MAG: hypothetical protein A2Z34_08210 [Planctomycetes bacterium RBG_16_59_8]
MNRQERDRQYLAYVVNAIRVCADYRPKLGHGTDKGYSLAQFQKMYRSDPFYNWIGLDNPLMYAAHKAAGGMTSVYRQIGIGCENLFRRVIQDTLALSEDDVKWSYTVKKGMGKTRTLYLDARIPTDSVADTTRRKAIKKWIADCAADLDVSDRVAATLQGVVFEVRQGYKSKDSKRQNADIANAATAYTKAYLPCVAILSLQIDDDVALRYRNEKWVLLTGNTAEQSSRKSLYTFMRTVIGYDLAAFFQRHSNTLKAEVNVVLGKLLASQ